MPASTPGMTPANPLQGQPAAAQRAVPPNGIKRVFRASRREAAPGQRPKKKAGRGGKHPIATDQYYQDVLRQVQTPALLHFNSLALRSNVKKSRSTWTKPLPTMDARATSTRLTGPEKSCWCWRKLSRNKRRARLRTTAFPSFPLVITPSREPAPAGKHSQFPSRQPLAMRSPRLRTPSKSRLFFSRAFCPNR